MRGLQPGLATLLPDPVVTTKGLFKRVDRGRLSQGSRQPLGRVPELSNSRVWLHAGKNGAERSEIASPARNE